MNSKSSCEKDACHESIASTASFDSDQFHLSPGSSTSSKSSSSSMSSLPPPPPFYSKEDDDDAKSISSEIQDLNNSFMSFSSCENSILSPPPPPPAAVGQEEDLNPNILSANNNRYESAMTVSSKYSNDSTSCSSTDNSKMDHSGISSIKLLSISSGFLSVAVDENQKDDHFLNYSPRLLSPISKHNSCVDSIPSSFHSKPLTNSIKEKQKKGITNNDSSMQGSLRSRNSYFEARQNTSVSVDFPSPAVFSLQKSKSSYSGHSTENRKNKETYFIDSKTITTDCSNISDLGSFIDHSKQKKAHIVTNDDNILSLSIDSSRNKKSHIENEFRFEDFSVDSSFPDSRSKQCNKARKEQNTVASYTSSQKLQVDGDFSEQVEQQIISEVSSLNKGEKNNSAPQVTTTSTADPTNDSDRFKYSNLKNTLRLEQEIWSLTEEITQLKQELSSYNEQTNILKQSLNEQEQIKESSDKKIDDLSEIVGQLSDTKVKIEQLEKEIEVTKTDTDSRIHSLQETNHQMKAKYQKNISQLEKSLSDIKQSKSETTTIGIQAVPPKYRTLSTTKNNINESRKGAMEHIRSHYQQKIKEMKKRHEQELKEMKLRSPRSDVKTHSISSSNSYMSSSPYTRTTNSSGINKGIQVSDTKNELNTNMKVEQLEVEQNLYSTVSIDALEGTNTSLTNELKNVTVTLRSFLDDNLQDENINQNNQQSLSTLLSKLKTAMENKDSTINQLQTKALDSNTLIRKLRSSSHLQNAQYQNQNNELIWKEAQDLQSSLNSAQVQIIQLQNNLYTLQSENSAMKTQLSYSISNPILTKYGDLSQKISDMERRSGVREEEIKTYIEKTRTSNEAEMRRMQQLHEEEIREKEDKIRGFRYELNSLMGKVKELMMLKESRGIRLDEHLKEF